MASGIATGPGRLLTHGVHACREAGDHGLQRMNRGGARFNRGERVVGGHARHIRAIPGRQCGEMVAG